MTCELIWRSILRKATNTLCFTVLSGFYCNQVGSLIIVNNDAAKSLRQVYRGLGLRAEGVEEIRSSSMQEGNVSYSSFG